MKEIALASSFESWSFAAFSQRARLPEPSLFHFE
jgi:hypothetical protein